MKLPLFILRLVYSIIRRLEIADATRLLYLAAGDSRTTSLPPRYELRTPQPDELLELIQSGKAPPSIGSSRNLTEQRRIVVIVTPEQEVISYLWLATQTVDAADNFSRSPHLGTSVVLPPRAAFLFNAWTHPDHRGKRLIGCMISHVIENRLAGTDTLMTTMDWTNDRSYRAFTHIGMRPIGTVIRLGRGPLQLSFLPRTATQFGFELAGQAPGYKFAF